MPLLELTDVHARYGPVRALHGVSLRVDEGEIVALLGANGAGKTTTLRAISGMVAREGGVVFDGKPLPRSPEGAARLGITHVPEGRGILAELTVRENLQMGAYLRRDRKGVAADLEQAYQELPWLAERSDQQAGTLSGGEQQMLALERALMSRPRLLLLDEPSLGLAPLIVREFFRLVRELNESRGLTVLVVEQNANVALDVSARAYLIEVGRVALEGESAELREHEGVRKSYLGY
ncbi:MAG TPA: ABC transporter ATP-binding protein [Gaiellaceae bacterium]|nr:ABC transporter ATP-binding protein [Gaiellaceae bacterium]